MGTHKKAPKKKTKTMKKQSTHPDFKGARLQFDIFEKDLPQLYRDDNIMVNISVWDSRILGDVLMGSIDLSVLEMMNQEVICVL